MRPGPTLERSRAHSHPRSPALLSHLGRVPRWLLSSPGLATLVTALFVAISVGWVLYDERVPDWDMGRHLGHIIVLRDQILGGAPFAWWHFESVPPYPPLVYLIGIAGTLVGGVNVDVPVLALNAVAVPLLAVGSYRVAGIAYERRAGVLAVLFALGAPMVISQFHIFTIDLTQAGFVAASAWLLLETERFSRPGMSMVAGLAVGAALLTKQTSAFFIAPLVAVMLLRGFLRDWRSAVHSRAAIPLLRMPACVLLFAGVALLVALPWYLEHSARLGQVAGEATFKAEATADGVEIPGRLSVENFSWYAWSLVNHQLFLPLAVFFAIGLAHAAVRSLRTRSRTDYGPELIAGVLGSFLLVALWFGYHDARYTVPALVYVAALGAGWIVRVRRPIQIVATAALVGVFVINTSAVNLGLLPGEVRITTGIALDRLVGAYGAVPEDSDLTVVGNWGYVVDQPHKGGEVLDLMRAAAEDGVGAVAYEESGIHLNHDGMGVLAQLAPIWLQGPYGGSWPLLRQYSGAEYNPVLFGDAAIYLVHRPPDTPWPEPCGRMPDGGGLYVFRGAPGAIDESGYLERPRLENLYCPLR